MTALELQLKRYAPLRIADELPEPGGGLAGLQKLIGGTLSGEPAQADVTMRLTETGKIYSRFDEARGIYSSFIKPPATERNKVWTWRRDLLLAFAARILRGEKIMLMHGCLLKTRQGGGLLLCGQSGMGKTTTANRWKAAGEAVAADDMILLEYDGDALFAHPLPTWSRCIVSLTGEETPFEEPLELESLMGLSRDATAEAVRDVEGFKYMASIYAACSLFNIWLVKMSSSARQKQLASAIKECAGLLYERFPHRMFFANLDGNIRQTLENW